ncbi:DMT family transporter [Pseudodesulfovibrio tunisiensis]|uniref:DMT family transporter n=1 Tax=Pseudodesulfovibrio tunisiensis TaxID=463192 RepID=UPI00311E673A
MGIYLKLVACMCFWGGTWVAGKELAQHLSPFSAALLRFSSASICLVIMTMLAEKRLPRLDRANLVPVLFLALTGIFGNNAFFFAGVKVLPAGRAALIVAALPSVVSLYTGLVQRERFTASRVLGIMCAFCGVLLIVSGGNPAALLNGGLGIGDLYLFGCVLSLAAYTIAGVPVMQRMSPLSTVTWACILGSLMFVPFALATGFASQVGDLTVLSWSNAAFIGIFGTAFAFCWFYEGVRAIGPSRAGTFINIVPVVAVCLAFLLLDEPPSPSLLTGGGMVLFGVWLTNHKTAVPRPAES